MHPTDKDARVAGVLYLLLAIFGFFSIMYVPSTIIVRGDAATTAENVLAHETLFRLGIAAEVFAAVVFVFLVLALHRLLGGVNEDLARMMVGLVMVSAAISVAIAASALAALTLFRGADFLTVFDEPQREALAMLFLVLHRQGLVVGEIFWGLWLFPFGLLVMRSGFLPRILGILLLVNGLAYVMLSLGSVLVPAYGGVLFRFAMPALFGELLIMLWLLAKGADVEPSAAS